MENIYDGIGNLEFHASQLAALADDLRREAERRDEEINKIRAWMDEYKKTEGAQIIRKLEHENDSQGASLIIAMTALLAARDYILKMRASWPDVWRRTDGIDAEEVLRRVLVAVTDLEESGVEPLHIGEFK